MTQENTRAVEVSQTDSSGLKWYGPLMVLAGGLCIGYAPIAVRLSLEEPHSLGVLAIALWRYILAVPFLFVLVVMTEKRLPRRPSVPILIGATCFALDISLWQLALTYTSVANATFLVNLGNVSVGLLAWIILKERPNRIWGVAIVVAVIGAAFLSLGGGDSSVTNWRGDLLGVGAAVLVMGYMVFSKIARRGMGGLEVIFWLTFFEVFVQAIVVWLAGESLLPVNTRALFWPLTLAIIAQVAGQGLIISGLGYTPAAFAGVLVLSQPVFAAILSWIFLGEIMTGLQISGGILILVGVYLSGQGRPPRKMGEVYWDRAYPETSKNT